MRKFYFTFGLIISCLAISFGQLYEVPFNQKVEESDLILEGRVTSQKQVLIEEVPYTLNSIEVVELMKGSPTLTSEVQVLTFGGNVNGERVFSAHTLTLRIGDEGVFFLTRQQNAIDDLDYYHVYSEKQGYYRETFNGRTKELISQFSKFKGRNTFYKELGLEYSDEGFQIESEKENCLKFRIEPANIFSLENSSLLHFNLYVKSIEPIKLRSSTLKVNYNINWFGENIIANENLTISSGDFNTSYLLNTQDITSDVFQIKLESNSFITGLNYLDGNTELLLCTFGVSIQDFDVEDPIYIENTKFDSKFYDTNGTFQEAKCGEINVESRACNPEIMGIDLKKSSGTESILEITGSGFIFDSVEPGDEWCGLPNDEHRVKFTDVNGGWVAPLEGDYLEWTDTRIRVKVPTEGYVNNSFNRSDFGMDEIAATGKIRVCINDNVFACTCFDTSGASDNSNDGELYVPFAIPSRDINPNATCIEAKSARLFSEASSFEIAFNIDALSLDAKNAFIRALNTWRCAIDINYILNSTGKIVSFGTIPSGLFALTPIGVGDCPDGEKAIDPKSITFDASTSWHFGTSNPPTNKVDFESVALHEIGHAIGLLHTNNTDNIMYPEIGAGISKRVLPNDDLDGGIFNQAKSLTPIICGSKLNPLTTDCNITTSIKQAMDRNIKHLFPNPLSESLNIESEEEIKAIQLYNLEGTIIMEDTNINLKKYIKNVSDLGSGVYIIKIYTSKSIESLKIIKL